LKEILTQEKYVVLFINILSPHWFVRPLTFSQENDLEVRYS
jgi:hypothetical protein